WQSDPRCPSRKDVNDLVMAKDPLTKKFADFLGNYGIPMPNVPEMAAVWGAMGDALAKVLDQGVAPEKALADAVAQIKAQIK
ncbi:MAG: maltose ABC transporter substrate-binding protein, partial [Fervidobacterium sp.]